MEIDILSARRNYLLQVIQDSLKETLSHTRSFVFRILGRDYEFLRDFRSDPDGFVNERYGGYPDVASIGFYLGSEEGQSPSYISPFLSGIRRLSERSPLGLKSLLSDDIAILGLSDGLSSVSEDYRNDQWAIAKAWLTKLVDQTPERRDWTYRMRELAGDLLDNRGRLFVSIADKEVSALALEIALRSTWPSQFEQLTSPTRDDYMKLLENILKQEPPMQGELEKASVWLKAIDLFVEETTRVLFPQTDTEKKALHMLDNIKAHLDQQAEAIAKRDFLVVIGLVLLVWAIIATLIYLLSWAVMEPWTYIVGGLATVIGYLYLAFTQKEFTPKSIFLQLKESRKKRIYKKSGFSPEEYRMLTGR
jgi:hypothetical protein